MTLTKNGLVKRISKETGLNKIQAFEVVQKTLDQISESLARGDKVELRNFGVFEVKIRKAKIGRNPQKPETDVPIPARARVKFKAGKEMRAEVLKLTPKLKKKAP
jgi:nucleoid DNA-binding protein